MSDWKTWRAHFEKSAARPRPSIEDARGVPERARRELAAALARFQLGETGEGRIAHEIDRSRLPGIDDDFRRALRLFVAEEGRHARILGDGVRALGGRRAAANRSHSAFTHGRRLLGVRTKLLALLTAEVVGIGFYGAIAERLGPGPLRAALREVAGDEAAHLRFHTDFFRDQVRHAGLPARAVFQAAWWPLCLGATAAVVHIESEALCQLGISRSDLFRSYLRLARGVERLVLAPTPATTSTPRSAPSHPAAQRQSRFTSAPVAFEACGPPGARSRPWRRAS